MGWRKRIEDRLKMIECKAHDFEYEHSTFGIPIKRCAKCGVVYIIGYDAWLQEQADMHYEKHCQMIEKINELEGGE